ncbi:MAG: permease [Ectothiorhodospiraceae bacterium]|nr:permease [Ectothiorhodospiraceae bacterium]
MLLAYVSVSVLLALVVYLAAGRSDVSHREAVRGGWEQLRPLLTRLPVALLAASFIAALIPERWMIALMGDASGFVGILLASLLGAILPGGPIVSFPLAMALFSAGVGAPQLVALLTAWAVLALHRVMTFEIPMIGWGFAWRRLVASLVLAPVAGLLAHWVLLVLHVG